MTLHCFVYSELSAIEFTRNAHMYHNGLSEPQIECVLWIRSINNKYILQNTVCGVHLFNKYHKSGDDAFRVKTQPYMHWRRMMHTQKKHRRWLHCIIQCNFIFYIHLKYNRIQKKKKLNNPKAHPVVFRPSNAARVVCVFLLSFVV